MKYIIIFFLTGCIACTAWAGSSGKYAYFSLAAVTPGEGACNGIWSWTVNGTPVDPGAEKFAIKIHPGGFDTVILQKSVPGEKRIVLTRFSEGKYYRLVPESCCRDADILDISANEKYDPMWASINGENISYDFEMMIDSMMRAGNTGQVVFTLKNAEKNQAYGAIFGDIHVSFTGGKLFPVNGKIKTENPFVTDGSSYFYHLVIGKTETRPITDMKPGNSSLFFTDETGTHAYVVKEKYVDVEYRFFRKETVYITYDVKTGKVIIRTSP